MNNATRTFTAYDEILPNTKKIFSGHLVNGYTCGLQISPGDKYLVSGDNVNHTLFWEWKKPYIPSS